MTAPRAAPGGETELWIAVLEFARPDGGRPLLAEQIQALITHLAGWHPTALFNPDRYAVQVQIPARNAHQGLQWALSYHQQAARAVGLAPAILVRIEVMTVAEYERSLEEYYPAATPAVAAAPLGLLCDELYSATRRLHAAATVGELSDIVIRFVLTIGGRVEPGPPRPRPGMIDIDISLEGDTTRHASADAVSVAGLLIEQSLPTLLADARQVLARLPRDRPEAE